MELILKWTAFAGIFFSHCKGHELSNVHLRIAKSDWVPFFMSERDADGDWKLNGILGEFLYFMQQARNMTFTLIEEPNGVWGNCEDAKNCTGMIGMVNRREVDLAIGMLLHTHHVLKFVGLFSFARTIHYYWQQVARCRLHCPSVCGLLGTGHSPEEKI